MSIVNVIIANNPYQMACEDGQEGHLQQLAEKLNQRIAGLAEAMHRTVDSRILAIAALMMEDEITELQKKQQSTANLLKNIPSTPPKQEAAVAVAYEQTIDAIADRIESLAKQLEKR